MVFGGFKIEYENVKWETYISVIITSFVIHMVLYLKKDISTKEQDQQIGLEDLFKEKNWETYTHLEIPKNKYEKEIAESRNIVESIIKKKIYKTKMDGIYDKLQEKKNSDEIEKAIDSFVVQEYESLQNDDQFEIIDNEFEDLKITKIPTKRYYRSVLVKEYVYRRANGFCELCGKPAPFKDNNDFPYLENHHIDWLSKGGKDTVSNCVALCSNCHRKIHVLDSEEDIMSLKLRTKPDILC